MDTVRNTIADVIFGGRVEVERAPKPCAAFASRLPFEGKIAHVRWSGEAIWIPPGGPGFGVSYEYHTSSPALGQVIFYPGGVSETEISIAYGGVHFASKRGQLAGNYFVTLISRLDKLAEIGRLALWRGAQSISFELTWAGR